MENKVEVTATINSWIGGEIICETTIQYKIYIHHFGNSVTRSGKLLDFGQLFKAFGNN